MGATTHDEPGPVKIDLPAIIMQHHFTERRPRIFSCLQPSLSRGGLARSFLPSADGPRGAPSIPPYLAYLRVVLEPTITSLVVRRKTSPDPLCSVLYVFVLFFVFLTSYGVFNVFC